MKEASEIQRACSKFQRRVNALEKDQTNWRKIRMDRTTVEDLIEIFKKSALHREKEVEKKLRKCLDNIDFVTWRVLGKVMIEHANEIYGTGKKVKK